VKNLSFLFIENGVLLSALSALHAVDDRV